MSLASLSPQRAGFMHLSTASSPVSRGCPPDDRMFDAQELEQRLRYLRDLMPTQEDCIERWKAEAQRDYDEIVALGGRPTRPIQHYPMYKTTMVDGMDHYRDDYEKVEVIFEVDDGRVATHWADESDRWIGELDRWRKFKEAQQLHNQSGRSQLELELETTDVALTKALSKLSDWQDFQFVHQKRVHEAEKIHEHCQQGIADTHGAMVAASNADATLEVQEPTGRWMSYMRKAQEQLEASQRELLWVKSQWTEVIAEACSSLAIAPELQEQLEAKLETQTNVIYRRLQQEQARPSHAVYAPDINAELPQRIQHWILESSAFKTELWDWRIFMAWRRRLRDAGNMDQEGQKLFSQGDTRAELFEDLVKYQREKIDRATSWVNCWRHRARQYMEARKRRLRYNRPRWPAREENNYNNDDDFYDETEVAQAKKAGLYASHAEEKVSVAARMLEESKQKLRDLLAESGPTPTAKHPAIQRLPTPPKSQSPESLPGRRRPSKGREPAGKGHRRSKKERARKEKAGMFNINTEQHALPLFSSGSDHLKEHDDEIEMSDHTEESNQADSENTVMSDAEDPPNYSPPSLPESRPKPTANKNHRKLPSSSSQSQTSRKTRSSTKLNQVSSSKIFKKPSKNKPLKKTKDFTDQQTKALLDIALTSSASTDPTSLGRNEPESYQTPTQYTNHRALPSPSSPISTSRETRSSTKLDQAASGGILKKSSKNKPLKKAKAFTEQQTMALLDAASTSYSSIDPSSLGRNLPESYPKPIPDINHRESPAPRSQTPTSGYPSTGPTSLGRNVPECYPRPTADTGHRELPPSEYQIPISNCPSTGPASLGRNIPESFPNPTPDTDHEKLQPPSSQTPMSRKTRVDQVPPGKILKKPSKNKPLENAAKVVTEASTGPTPPRRSERLKRKAVATSRRPVRI